MLKEGDRILWRCKDELYRGYTEGFVKEVNGKMLLIADSQFELKQWFNSEEIEIEILERS